MPGYTISRGYWIFLGAILAACAVLYSWNLGTGGFSDYYATAARSMAISWRALAFGAFDPNATITLDKLAGFLVPQALSVRAFGFSALALGLPQVIEGLITVAAVFYLAARWIGPRGGVIAALSMAFTPLLVSMFSHPMEDSMLTMFTALAVVAWQRSIELDRTRWLVVAGVMVGLGFQAKMMQSWLVLPALALVYLAVAQGSRRRRLARIAAMGSVAFAVSVSWMTVIGLVPASARPYIDGTSNNDIVTMVFGYNGLNHFLPGLVPGALHPAAAVGDGSAHAPSLLVQILGHTPIKLLFPEYVTQVGWLYPLVVAGVVLGLVSLRRRRRAGTPVDSLGVSILFSLAYALTLFLILGIISLPHTAYLASLALPLSILAAIGGTLLWRSYRRREPRWKYALPITLFVQSAWVCANVSGFPAFAAWIIPITASIGIIGAALLLYAARGRAFPSARGTVAAIAALTFVLVAPVTWSVSTLDLAYAGSPNDAYAGPHPVSIFNPPLRPTATYGSGLSSNRARPSTAANEDSAYDYANARAASLTYVLATDSWRSDAPLIMDDARRTLAIGGFTSKAPFPDVAQIEDLVESRQLRFLLLTGSMDKNAGPTPRDLQFRRWAQHNCEVVPVAKYAPGSHSPDVLYDCVAAGRNSP